MPRALRSEFSDRRLKVMVAAAGASLVLLSGCANGGDADSPATTTDTGSATQEATAPQETGAADSSAATEAATASPAEGAGHTEAGYVENAVNSGYPLNTVDDLPVVTMYTDYECPACQSAHPLVEQAAESLDGEVTVVVKNFPLPMHENAVPAARAVEAAGIQGQAHDYASDLYENADDWTDLSGSELDDYFAQTAQDQGLDQQQFTTDYSSDAVPSIVDAHASQAEDLDLAGTPSFVVGDSSIDLEGVQTADDLANAFQDAVDEAGAEADTPAGGTVAPTAAR